MQWSGEPFYGIVVIHEGSCYGKRCKIVNKHFMKKRVSCWLYYFNAIFIQKALAEHIDVKGYYCSVESKYILSSRRNSCFIYLACTDTGPMPELYIQLWLLLLMLCTDNNYSMTSACTWDHNSINATSSHLPTIVYYDSYSYLTEDVNSSMLNITVIDQISII